MSILPLRMLNQETGQTDVMKEASLSRALSRGQLPAWEVLGLEDSECGDEEEGPQEGDGTE